MTLTYSDVHHIIYTWIDKGLWKFDGTRDTRKFAELDRFIFEVFGYKVHPRMMYQDTSHMYVRFNRDIGAGKIDPSWLFSPHGLTLFKAKIARGA